MTTDYSKVSTNKLFDEIHRLLLLMAIGEMGTPKTEKECAIWAKENADCRREYDAANAEYRSRRN